MAERDGQSESPSNDSARAYDEGAARARLSALMLIAADAIISADSAQRITTFNNGAERVFGYTASEVIGQALTILLPPEKRAAHAAYVDAFRDEKNAARRMGERGRISGQRKNGEIFPAEASIAHIEIAGEYSYTVILRDVSETVRLEAAMQASESRLRAMYDGASEFIGLLDTRGILLEANRAALELVNLKSADVVGRPFWDTAWWSHSPALQERLKQAVARAAGGAVDRFDAQHPSAHDEMIDVEFSLTPIRGADGRVHSLLPEGRDVTMRVKAQAAAEAALQAKSRFLAVASHDLRQPLQAAGMLASALVRRANDPELRDVAQQQQRSLAGASALLDALLDLSKLESGTLKPVTESIDLGSLISQLAEEIAEKARQASVRLSAPQASFQVRSDRVWLRQILQNLLANALRYTPAGGQVLLQARGDNGTVHIEVRDTGVGIPASKIDRIFDEFYQIEAGSTQRKGWGLGLAIVKHAAQMLGHEVRVESELGRGTLFVVSVPEVRQIQTEITTDAASGLAEKVSLPKCQSVLIIEDDDAVAKATSMLLKVEGFSVYLASGHADVDRWLSDPDFSPQVILSDIQLSDKETGPELVRVVRHSLRRIVPALLLSGDTSMSRGAALTLENSRYLSKPVEADRLVRVLQEMIDTSSVAT